MSRSARPATLSSMILIGYDGSPDAKEAIKRAGELMRGRPATVFTVWEQFEDMVTRVGAGMPIGVVDYAELDRSYEELARQRAEEGAESAREAGLKAQAHACARSGSIAETILFEADDIGAEAIVLGTRGLTGLKSLLLGSVSHAVLQHADRPVIVVPSPEVAAARAAHRG
jgi:nucleotide-binding universal stress UspA family protein